MMSWFRKSDLIIKSPFLVLFWAVLFLVLLGFGFREKFLLTFPFTIDYGESALLHQVHLLSKGIAPYAPLQKDLISFFTYTPLVQYLTSVVSPDPQVWLLFLRFVQLLSFGGAGWVLVLISRRYHKNLSLSLGVLIIGFWFLWYPVFVWAGLARLDGPALFLQVTGLYFYLRSSKRDVLFASLFWIIAFWVKQTAVWIPLAVFIYELIQFRKLKNLWLWGSYMGVQAVLLAFVQWKSSGSVWDHLFVANQGPYSVLFLLLNLKVFTLWNAGMLLSSVVALYFLFRDSHLPRLLSGLLLLTTLPFVVAFGKEGSNVNYLLELCWALTMAVAFTLPQWKFRNTALGILAIAFLGFSFPMLKYAALFINKTDNDAVRLEYGIEGVNSQIQLLNKLQQEQGEVWVENYSLLLFVGKNVEFMPFELGQAFRRNELKPDKWIEILRAKKPALIILKNEKYGQLSVFPRELKAELEKWYYPSFENFEYVYYKPVEL